MIDYEKEVRKLKDIRFVNKVNLNACTDWMFKRIYEQCCEMARILGCTLNELGEKLEEQHKQAMNTIDAILGAQMGGKRK